MKKIIAVMAAAALAATLVVSSAGAHYGAPFRKPGAMAWEIKRHERSLGMDIAKVGCFGTGEARQGKYQHFWCTSEYYDGGYITCKTHLTGWSYFDYKETN